VARPQGRQAATVFYPLGHPTPYALNISLKQSKTVQQISPIVRKLANTPQPPETTYRVQQISPNVKKLANDTLTTQNNLYSAANQPQCQEIS
jgi:hypothetical protein